MHPATKHSTIMGICFLILFTAYFSFSTIVTQIHEQDGNSALGPTLLATNYFFFMLTSLFAPAVTLSYKLQVTMAALGYALNFSTGLSLQYVETGWKYAISMTGAGIAGVGAGATNAALVVLPAMGFEVTIVALLISIEPLIDMARTALNVNGAITSGMVTNRLVGHTVTDAQPEVSADLQGQS